MATARKQTPNQAKKSALQSDFAPFYALAGLTEIAAEKMSTAVRARIEERQQQIAERLTAFRGQPSEVRAEARRSADELAAFLRDLPTQVRDLPNTAQTQIAALQRRVEEYRAEAESTYGDLAGRGKRTVDEALQNARTASGRAADPAFERVQETVTTLRQNVTGHATTATTTTRTAAKASKTSTAKTPSTNTTAKKTAPAKKATAKKV